MLLTDTRKFEVWRQLRFLPIISLLSISTACTSAVPQDSPPLPEFESVAIVSMGATRELKTRFGVDPEYSNLVVGASYGAGAGAGLLVGVSAALACGPFVLLCAMATVPAGVVVGGVGSGLTAEAVDANKKLPNEQLLVLDGLFVEISQQRTIHLEVRDTLEQQIPPDRLADKSVADTVLSLTLSDVRFTQTSSGKYALTLKSIVVAQWIRNTRQRRHSTRFYQYTSSSLPLDDWVHDDGKKLNQAFDDCVEGLVEQMVGDIRLASATWRIQTPFLPWSSRFTSHRSSSLLTLRAGSEET
jgi:hypothetical protein